MKLHSRLAPACMQLLLALPAVSAPAVNLVITDCAPVPAASQSPVPCPAVIPIYRLGVPGTFWVSAVDSTGFRATDFSGTVVLSSSDASAVISPRSHAFTSADNGALLVTINFRTAGSSPGFLAGTSTQLVGASDSASGLAVSIPLLVAALAVPLEVPALGSLSLLILAGALALAGSLSLARRQQ